MTYPQAIDYIKECDALLDLQHRRSREAEKLWQSAHPDRKFTTPDLGELLQWLMDERKKAMDRRQVLELELKDHTQHRHWNVKDTDQGIAVCRGEHERGEDCRYEEYTPVSRYQTETTKLQQSCKGLQKLLSEVMEENKRLRMELTSPILCATHRQADRLYTLETIAKHLREAGSHNCLEDSRESDPWLVAVGEYDSYMKRHTITVTDRELLTGGAK